MTCKVAFIGLGVMGYPMAGYISKAGHNVTVYNRTTAKADKWLTKYKGSKNETPAKAADGADFVFTCVGNDNDLKEVTFGKNGIDEILEKKKQENASNKITKKANLEISISSIFCPTQINKKLLARVADA